MKTTSLGLQTFKALMMLLSFVLLLGSCQDNTPPKVIISGTVSDTTGKPLADYKISLIGLKSRGFLSVPDIVQFYRLQTDASGRFSQQVVWDKSIDYYEPDFDFAEYDSG